MTGETTVASVASFPDGSVAEAPRGRGFWQWNPHFGIGSPIGRCGHTDPHTGRTEFYDFATWTAPEVGVGAATEVVASWTARTPPGTWLQVDLRGVTECGERTKIFVMGRWSADDTPRRTSVSGQGDRHGDVLVDRFVAADGHALTRLRLSVTLYRPAGSSSRPWLRSVAAVATRPPRPTRPNRPAGAWPASDRGRARGVVLDVPRYSQLVHRGEYPQWGGGGEAWCSPTCTAMILAFWGCGPTARECAWVDPAFADPCVHHAVRGIYDHAYRGTGNWAFNIAYAGQLGLSGFVIKFHALAEAEAFIAAGVPLVLSVAGHPLVLVGFTTTSDPVLNDPASPSDDEVRKTVDRCELETAWQTSSQGVAYVIHPASVRLPALPVPTGTLA
jgi:hypothetical protein